VLVVIDQYVLCSILSWWICCLWKKIKNNSWTH